ncbi:MAG: hypothetical protein IKS48_06720 [Eubacterium sp.]|nr:hypothetical protein [Eubacterium sp.]
MRVVQFDMNCDIDDDIRRSICFISDKIITYEVVGRKIKLLCDDEVEKEELNKSIIEFQKRKEKTDDEIYYSTEQQDRYWTDDEVLQGDIVKKYYDGSIVLDQTGIKLFEFFDQLFVSILDDMPVILKKYPTSIEMDTLIDTGYLINSPQHPMLCMDIMESMNNFEKIEKAAEERNLKPYLSEAKFALSPSACFSLYKELRGQVLKEDSIFSFRQNVFRNEGRLNWDELHRLRDYNVREIVFIGDKEYVYKVREELLKRVIEKLKNIGLKFKVEIASDPFVLPALQSYRKIQKKFKVKYELRLSSSPEETIACASFNLHGSTFANRFHFSKEGNQYTESGCIGFGIERCIIAFIHQYGLCTKNWPEQVRDYIGK